MSLSPRRGQRSRVAEGDPPPAQRRWFRPLAFVVIGTLSVGVYSLAVRTSDGSIPGWVLSARRRAVQIAARGERVIRAEHARLGVSIPPEDRLDTGMIGPESSPTTTGLGSLAAKRTSTNPLFAATITDMLYGAGVRPGDGVAIGMSGSFPAWNLDAIVATEQLRAIPLMISSIGSSQFGANDPLLTWPSMEAELFRARIIHHRSLAVAVGGPVDPESDEGMPIRRAIAERSGLLVVPPMPLDEDVDLRVALYRSHAAAEGSPIRAFVNVGGSAVDVGAADGSAILPPGVSRPHLTPFEASRLGLVGKFAGLEMPVVNMLSARRLAERFDLPWDPDRPPRAVDLEPPPPDRRAVAVALIVVLAVVGVAFRLGALRIQQWQMPPGLLERTVAPGGGFTAQANGSSVPEASVDANGHGAGAGGAADTRAAAPAARR
jgi:poly-gamma-glutamate system protein